MGNFSKDVFKYINGFACPCCTLSYYKNYEGTAFEFEEGFGSGSAIQVGDNLFECGYCGTILDARTGNVVKKPLKKHYLNTCSEEQMADALKKFSNISDIKFNGKTISFVDANGKVNEVDVMEALLMSHIAKAGGLEDEISSYVSVEAENDKIRKENEELKTKYPEQPDKQPIKGY